jgi:hypothetical protein
MPSATIVAIGEFARWLFLIPEPETGYVDEYAVCESCKSGDTKREDPMGWTRGLNDKSTG